jgi:hypothetical protein
VRRTRLGKLLSRLLEQLFVGLNNDSNKLLKLPRRVRREVSRQTQKIEQLRSLRVVDRLQVLQQLCHHLSHNTAEQSSFQQNIDSYIYQSRHIELTPRRYRNNSYCRWLNSLKFGDDFGVRSAHYAGHYVIGWKRDTECMLKIPIFWHLQGKREHPRTSEGQCD